MKSDIKENRPSCLRFVFPSNVRVQLVISYSIKLSCFIHAWLASETK